MWLLFCSVTNKSSYCSPDMVLHWIVWLLVQFSILAVISQLISCYSELCDFYSVQFSILVLIAQLISCYSELCDCYSVQIAIHIIIVQRIWCCSELCDCNSFRSQYILLLFSFFRAKVCIYKNWPTTCTFY